MGLIDELYHMPVKVRGLQRISAITHVASKLKPLFIIPVFLFGADRCTGFFTWLFMKLVTIENEKGEE